MQATVTKTIKDVESIKGAIAAKMDSANYTSWIAPLQFEISDNTLILIAQNQFSADYISSVHSHILNSVAAEYGLALNITVRARAVVANDNTSRQYTPIENETKRDTSAFDRFVASEENSFVLAACKKVAFGAVPFSPLYIYGPSGCGKTLLAECIRDASGARVIMMSGAQFVAEFVRSLQEHNNFKFKDYCRDCDTFILDNVQALSGKRAAGAEFLQLVVDLHNAGRNIVVTADAAPGALTGFTHQAQSLLASGLVSDIVAPNTFVKRALFVRAGLASGVADSVAARIGCNGHLVAGVVNKIKTYTELMGAQVDANVAMHLLSDTLQNTQTPISMVRRMCEKLGVSYDAVCGAGRARALVLARQIMMVVLKGATNMTLSEIGNIVGGRDHASVLYAIRQIEKLQATDLVLSAQISEMVAEFK